FVRLGVPWLSGVVHDRILPMLDTPSSTSRFGFLFSHLLALSVVPALLAGAVNARLKVKAANFVWIAPMLVLAVRVVMDSGRSSVLETHLSGFPAALSYSSDQTSGLVNFTTGTSSSVRLH